MIKLMDSCVIPTRYNSNGTIESLRKDVRNLRSKGFHDRQTIIGYDFELNCVSFVMTAESFEHLHQPTKFKHNKYDWYDFNMQFSNKNTCYAYRHHKDGKIVRSVMAQLTNVELVNDAP